MAKKQIDVEKLFNTMPPLPDGFEDWCFSHVGKIPIFYKRKRRYAECVCGKCGDGFTVIGEPERHTEAKCFVCGHKGVYEWAKVTRKRYEDETFYLIQKTSANDLVVRIFRLHQYWQQGYIADKGITEQRRIFLTYGDAIKTYNGYYYTGTGWKYHWGLKGTNEALQDGYLYPGWQYEIRKSNLKYCDVDQILSSAHWKNDYYSSKKGREVLDALIAYSNNPAIEMYAKKGMDDLVRLLVSKEGKSKYINRRGDTLKKQLRLKDKSEIKRFIKSKGNIDLLKILQAKQKYGHKWHEEQEQFLLNIMKNWYGEKWLSLLLKYMTVQQLMNRIEKYMEQGGFFSAADVVSIYFDYLTMRRDLGYDMTNEIYLYPKILREKHDEMVKEKNVRANRDYITRKKEEYHGIAEKYGKAEKRYFYQADGYVIRPARDAGEIIMEGRTLHHCVGGDNYLKRHDKGSSYILFLRKEEYPDTPYYTIEIRDTDILQWYGLRDKKPDAEIIAPWLDRYVQHLKDELRVAG